MKLLERDRFDPKEKQTEKKKKTLGSDLYRIYSSDPPIISKKNFNKLNRKLFLMTDKSGQIIQKHTANLRSK